jgi:hypothetical protein
MCSCGTVGIDGGTFAGNRILGDLSDIENRSMFCAIVDNKKIYLPQDVMEEHFKTHRLIVKLPN